MIKRFLPISASEMKDRGWDYVDVILITGDAYVDHPSYGTAIISRVLEDKGYRVGIIAQPDWRKISAFQVFGRPRLFAAITGGNIDSMIAHYTANKKPRSGDDYSPGGKAGLRPDRAVIIYANKVREAFPQVPLVIGGLEASMRRLAHYDYWSDTVRRSILLDSKADILVYGMGESQISEIAERLNSGEAIKELDDIRGTVVGRSSIGGLKNYVEIASFEDVAGDPKQFADAIRITHVEADPFRGNTIVQRHAKRYCIQYPPALPLKPEELDHIYELPYTREAHPVYRDMGGVPGLDTVRSSITSHRGCPGGCNFCSLFLHQGRIVQSRTPGSIEREASALAKRSDFRGTITDIGGPTANLYAAECAKWSTVGACKDRQCLAPKRCTGLKTPHNASISLWDRIMRIPGVKHLFIGSGIRYDLLTGREDRPYLDALCARHVSGQLKIAPEHTDDHILALMGKPPFTSYYDFADAFLEANKKFHKKQFLVHYLISGHPGSTLEHALQLALKLIELNIYPEQIQDFIPLPMTISGAMYHTGLDPFTMKRVYVPKGERERKLQRALIQYRDPKNRRYVNEALEKLGRKDLRKVFIYK